MIPQHSTKTNEHPTPAVVVELARHVLGRIDLDPASSVEMNERVRAVSIFTEMQDGLADERPWKGRVFLNPPGGALVPSKAARKRHPAHCARLDKAAARWQTKSTACAWWRKLAEEWAAGRVREAIFVGFTLELLRSAQGGEWHTPLDFAICVPEDRLQFKGGSPTHANVIVYLGPNVEKFVRSFSALGVCRTPTVQLPQPKPARAKSKRAA